MKFFRYHWKALFWIVIIYLGCLLPGDALPSILFLLKIPYFDKIMHFGLYFVYTLFLASGFLLQYPGEHGKAYLLGGLIAFSIGISIEFLQSIMHLGRLADFYDAIANTIGIIVALLLFKSLQRLFPWAL
ncbi:MAG: VanZ family protein [Prevotellaceae bacterium]|nr:VanZ family protein [Prevotellaceae bacterium]